MQNSDGNPRVKTKESQLEEVGKGLKHGSL
jgi:hypothetical protein